jgi:hypothetical protein
MTTPHIAIAAAVASCLFFLAMWLGVGALLARLSGWSALSAKFPCEVTPAGGRAIGQVVAIGAINERNVTWVIVSSSGLYLSAIWPFRFRRPPVLVPWRHVRYVSEQTFLWSRCYVVDLGNITTVRLKARAYELVAPFVKGPVPSSGEV